ncbi:MAG: zinc ABC transporter substrate-binding protein [Mariprofundaceae bacterium]|nr:zinc ABC transporter substrate-binding protein [Mariprofundaceae bacterium]
MLIKQKIKQYVFQSNTQQKGKHRIFPNYAIIVTFTILCVTCITDATAKNSNQDLPIEATLPAIGGILHWIAPEMKVHCLLPKGAEPHHFRPSARQLERANNSPLLVRSSRDDLAWFKTQHVQSKHILDLWPHDEKGKNHAWLLPSVIGNALPLINNALTQTFPAFKNTILKHQPDLQHSIKIIEQAWANIAIPLRKHGIIMQHAAWLPLFEAYQIPVLAVLEKGNMGHNHGYNAKKLDQALKQLQKHPNAILIADQRHDDKGLKWLQRQHPSSQLVYLDAVGTCDQPWPLLMQYNIDLLVAALHKPQ